jgi:hypothetical protein
MIDYASLMSELADLVGDTDESKWLAFQGKIALAKQRDDRQTPGTQLYSLIEEYNKAAVVTFPELGPKPLTEEQKAEMEGQRAYRQTLREVAQLERECDSIDREYQRIQDTEAALAHRRREDAARALVHRRQQRAVRRERFTHDWWTMAKFALLTVAGGASRTEAIREILREKR